MNVEVTISVHSKNFQDYDENQGRYETILVAFYVSYL